MTRGKGQRIIVLVLVAVITCSCAVAASLRVADFLAELDIRPPSILGVTETLTVDFASAHHGIFREIKVSERLPSGERAAIRVSVNALTLDGAPVPFEQRRSGDTVVLKIGDAQTTVIGRHIYRISYDVERAYIFSEESVQLYWNVTGNDWRIPIDHASAVVSLPQGVEALSVLTTSYAPLDSFIGGAEAVVDAQGRLVFEIGSLSPGEGLTIDVLLPRSASGLVPATVGDDILWFVRNNLYALIPIIVFVLMFVVWWRKGRDPRKGTIAPQFSPPPDLHPGEAGIVIDDRADLRDISAMIIGLAVKGHLRIRAEKAQDGDEIADHVFERLQRERSDLSASETKLLDAVFDDAHSDERPLSSMENSFYRELPAIKSKLYSGLIAKGLYPSNPERVRSAYVTGGIVIGVFGLMIAFSTALYLGAVIAASGAIIAAFGPIMPRKTSKGVRALETVLGLAEYIGRAERDRIEFHHAPDQTPRHYEELLPYAMAFDLTDAWSRSFEGAFREPPSWYVGAGPVFHGHVFALSMMRLSSGMNRTFVSAPRTSGSGRSAWGGGASFGGGFSGGGFGGGGGGGW